MRICPSCFCTAKKPCAVLLPNGAGVGQCSREVPGHGVCSACLTPELRATEAKLRAFNEADSRATTATLDVSRARAEAGMCFRVYFWSPKLGHETLEGLLADPDTDYYVQDRRFTHLQKAAAFSIGQRKEGFRADLRYEASWRV